MLLACLIWSLWLVASAADVSLNNTGTSTQEKPEVVHCFCNLLQCITSGYMCKSQGKGCFSDLQTNMDVDRALHGCLDLLAKEKHNDCRNVPSGSLNGDGNLPSNGSNSVPRHEETNPPSSLLLCCHQDMCNHIDSQETRTKYNETILAVGGVVGSSVDLASVHGDWRGGYENIRWFKVATIAVPICGALILLVLIALALKILSHETLQHTSLGVKLRGKHHHHHMFPDVGMGSGFGGRDVQNHRAECSSSSEKKLLPLLYHENDTGCGGRRAREGEPTKNEAYAKLNCALAGTGDAACRSGFLSAANTKNTTSCNLLYNHHQYAFSHPPLLTLGQPDKLDYKRILPSHNLPAYR